MLKTAIFLDDVHIQPRLFGSFWDITTFRGEVPFLSISQRVGEPGQKPFRQP
jgi:hypothetical protein